MDSEVVEVLKEIRDGVKATISRLDETNARLESLETTTNARLETVDARLQFVEKRIANGFATLGEKIDKLAREQLSGFVTVEGVLGRVHAAIINNVALLDHERRLNAIEKQHG
jgi:hypothetical protein